jgi:hypothetical protein
MAAAGVVHGYDEAIQIRVLIPKRVAQVCGERRNPALTGEVVAENRDLSNDFGVDQWERILPVERDPRGSRRPMPALCRYLPRSRRPPRVARSRVRHVFARYVTSAPHSPHGRTARTVELKAKLKWKQARREANTQARERRQHGSNDQAPQNRYFEYNEAESAASIAPANDSNSSSF